MENNTQQPNSLDPQAVQLSQSIRQVESGGNFEAKGASGEYGAYQFEPATWNKEAPSVLGSNVPLDKATPEQQNQVAYTKIKQLKDSGMNVGQIASTWNAGNPNAYLENHIGTNAEGVKYDTPDYAKRVAQTYQTIKSGGQITPDISGTPNTPDTSSKGMSTLEKILYGLGGAGLVAGGIALAPETGGASLAGEGAGLASVESALGAGEITGAGGGSALSEGASGLLNGAKNLVTNPTGTLLKAAGIGELGQTIVGEGKKLLGIGDSSKANADEQANATAQAGAEEANQSKQNEQSQEIEQEDLADEKASQEALQNSKTLEENYNNTLMQTASGTKLAQTPQGQMGVQGLAQSGVLPTVNADTGKFETLEDQNKINEILSELDNKEQDLHTASGDMGNLDAVGAEAKMALRNDKSVPSTDWEAGDKIIDERIKGYKERMGSDNVSLGRGGIGQVRSDGSKAYDRNASSISNKAGKALNRGANKHMLDRSSSKELVGGLHKEKEKLIHGKTILKHLDGKKAPQNHGFLQKLLHGTGKYAALYIGDKLGGPIGAVIGDMVGKNIIKAVDKRYGKNIFEKPAVRKAMEMLRDKDPKIYGKIEKKLKQYGVKAEAMKKEANRNHAVNIAHQAWQVQQKDIGDRIQKQLSAPSYIPMGAKTSQPEPAKVLQANKNKVSVSPKSGKFQTSYNSGGMMPKKELEKKLGGLFGGNVKTKKKGLLKS